MNFIYLSCAILLFFAIGDLHQHNKKVEKMFPDPDDKRQSDMRRELTISLFGFYFVLIILVGASVLSLIKAFFG